MSNIIYIINIKLQHPVAHCRSYFVVPLFAVYMQRQLVFTRHLLFSLYHYIFRPNRPLSDVEVVVMKESTAYCNAVLLFLCNCLRLIVGNVN
jgi:hypothetical protein